MDQKSLEPPGQGQHQNRPMQSTQGRETKVPPVISKDITDRLIRDTLQCFSLSSNRDKFCDFTIVVGDMEFPCHRFVLSACSDFFEAMLRSDMKETRENRATVHGISPEIFKLVLDVIYGSSQVLVPDKMIDIWKAAHQLQIQLLMSACENLFIKSLNFDNSFFIYNVARQLHSPQVKSSVLNYLMKNFYALVQSESFMKLGLCLFFRLLQNKDLPICPDFKIEAILKWCEAENKKDKSKSPNSAQGQTRLVFLSNLLALVGLEKITKACLATLLTNPFIQGDKTACSVVNSQAAKYLVSPSFEDDDLLRHFSSSRHSFTVYKQSYICQHCKQSAKPRASLLDHGKLDFRYLDSTRKFLAKRYGPTL